MKPYPDLSTLPDSSTLLRQLVSLPSVNPDQTDLREEPFGEARVAAFLADFLKPWADEIILQEVFPGRPNLIARFDGLHPGPAFALEAHSDTVGVLGMTIDPFSGSICEQRLEGRGACDDKGPMAAMLLGLLRHLATQGRPPFTWYFISTCDEELGGGGARHLMEQGFRCDGIIVGEPTEMFPLIEHKGALRLEIRLQGKAGHSAYPEAGASAIHAAADLITRLEKTIAALPPCPDAELGGVTLNIGKIEGGDQVNRIADLAVLHVDLRLPPGVEREDILTTVDHVIQEIHLSRSGIWVTNRVTQYYPPYKMKDCPVFSALTHPLFHTTGGESKKARYATNAGFFAEAGIPCLIIGPGSVAQAHTANEWIDLKSVDTAIQLFQSMVGINPELTSA